MHLRLSNSGVCSTQARYASDEIWLLSKPWATSTRCNALRPKALPPHLLFPSFYHLCAVVIPTPLPRWGVTVTRNREQCYAVGNKDRCSTQENAMLSGNDHQPPSYDVIPTCVPCGIIRETLKEGKKTCFGYESHTSRSSCSSGRSQTSHENGSTLLGSRALGDYLPCLN